MDKIRIGVICPSEIAFRRFMPAVQKCDTIEYIGTASASAVEWFGEGQATDNSIIVQEHEKALEFQKEYGGEVFNSYTDLLKSDNVDAIYLPLPPALHFKWAKKALEYGKHIFLEKPSTTSAKDTKELIALAEKKGLAVHENYMFVFHKQIEEIKDIINSGELGDVRLYRIAFGFPQRSAMDFRYNKALGGGALLDCGGYTLKLAQELLGESAQIVYSNLNYTNQFDVDIYGSAAMINAEGVTAQLAFGMDNSYKCELEVWGSKGSLITGRILTAPAGLEPTAVIKTGNQERTISLSSDDTFAKSICFFGECVTQESVRYANYNKLIKQAELVDQVKGE